MSEEYSHNATPSWQLLGENAYYLVLLIMIILSKALLSQIGISNILSWVLSLPIGLFTLILVAVDGNKTLIYPTEFALYMRSMSMYAGLCLALFLIRLDIGIIIPLVLGAIAGSAIFHNIILKISPSTRMLKPGKNALVAAFTGSIFACIHTIHTHGILFVVPWIVIWHLIMFVYWRATFADRFLDLD